ncbi:MAG: MBL fold metallo-hydrolase [Verrucomicrobiales bacterium]
MIVPVQKDEILLADVAAARCERDDFHLWWLGQSGFLLKWRDRRLLFDPYLSDSLTAKYAGTDKEHVRMTERCVDPACLDMISIVTSSHAHTDHLDADTLRPLRRANPGLKLILPAANIETAASRLGADAPDFVGLDADATTAIEGLEFTAVPSAHNEIERDQHGRCLFLGFIVRFGPWTLYHSGDTMWHSELPQILTRHSPNVVLLPINGHRPERRVAGNLNGTEAAALARVCGSRLAIPHHFEMFSFNTEPPDEFVHACGRLQQPFRVLKCGERLTLTVDGR